MASYWQQILEAQAYRDAIEKRRADAPRLLGAPYRARMLLGDMNMQDQPEPNYMDVRGALQDRGMNPRNTSGMPPRPPQLGMGSLGQARNMMAMGADPGAMVQSQMQARADMDKPVELAAGAGMFSKKDGSPIVINNKPEKPAGPESILGKLRADLDAGLIDLPTYNKMLAKETNIPATGPQFNPTEIEKGLRGEFDAKTKDFGLVRDAFSKITKVADDPSPAGDISLIFSYMKMLDPGSTVREGEYATAQNAGSIPNTVWARYNKAVAGETLTPPQREDFVSQASNIYESQLGQYNNDYERYTALARGYSVKPENVVYDRTGGVKPRAKKKAPPGPPPIGKNGKPMKWVPE